VMPSFNANNSMFDDSASLVFMSSLSKVVLEARVGGGDHVDARARAIKVELHVLVATCKAFLAYFTFDPRFL